MQGVFPSTHPLIHEKLGKLRDHKTPAAEFRKLLEDISSWLFYEATRDLPTRPVSVQTPLARTRGVKRRRRILLVPVLRAGLGMLNGILEIVPDAEVGFIGLQRNEQTLAPESYYERLPKRLNNYDVFLLDPMLATGGSSVAALDKLISAGARHIKMISLVAAPEGIRVVKNNHAALPIFCAAVDECLNDIGFIVPGLGDAGDRLFGR
jgi:uracil phosphoribosyltransferase